MYGQKEDRGHNCQTMSEADGQLCKWLEGQISSVDN